MKTDLKKYVRQAKDLEVAIYTQKQLMDSYEATVNNHKPVKPKLSLNPPEIPREPQNPGEFNIDSAGDLGPTIFFSILVLFFGILAITLPSYLGFLKFIFFIAFIVAVIFLISFVVDIIRQKKDHYLKVEQYNQELPKYEKEKLKYNIEYKKYLDRKKQAYKQHTIDMEKYNKLLDEFNEHHNQMTEKNNNLYNELTTALKKLYSEDIVFPKYRNLVALSTIYEYLMSGRCDTLEGADGAYNLYENELRQNLVIGQLSQVVENLEQVKNNQYTLYDELQKSNTMVNEIINQLDELNNETKLNTYYTQATAMATTVLTEIAVAKS